MVSQSTITTCKYIYIYIMMTQSSIYQKLFNRMSNELVVEHMSHHLSITCVFGLRLGTVFLLTISHGRPHSAWTEEHAHDRGSVTSAARCATGAVGHSGERHSCGGQVLVVRNGWLMMMVNDEFVANIVVNDLWLMICG